MSGYPSIDNIFKSKILVHGFTLDEHGRKMSKSLGNVVDPQDISLGGPDLKKKPAYGVDILRWWVAAHATQHMNILVNQTTINDSMESVKKLRNTLKFLLGSIHDFPKHLIDNAPKLSIIDQYMMKDLLQFKTMVDNNYNEFQINKVCSAIMNYITNRLSGFYCHVTKDRLYCNKVDSNNRRAVQYTMYHALNTLTQIYAPIMPILAEEVFLHHPHNTDNVPFFFQQFSDINLDNIGIKPDIDRIMETAFKVKEEVIKEIPINLNASLLGCTIRAGKDIWPQLCELQKDEKSTLSELVDLFQMSSVKLIMDENCENVIVKVHESGFSFCKRCRRCTALIEGDTCLRCTEVLESCN